MTKNISTAKTQFTTDRIRPLRINEQRLANAAFTVMSGAQVNAEIATIPKFISKDDKERQLILNENIVAKIIADHGNLCVENLIINANDWDVVMINIDSNTNKINLIKFIPDSKNYLVIGANRDNGYFLVTHYEVIPNAGNELKSLLGRGDSLDKNGFPLEPFVNGTFFCESRLERVSSKGTDACYDTKSSN